MQENSLSALMAECMQTKVKNIHRTEILNMQREFANTYDKLKDQAKMSMETEYGKDLSKLKDNNQELIEVKT